MDVAERFADRNASREELKAAYLDAELAKGPIFQRIKEINSAGHPDAGGRPKEESMLFNIDDWHPEGRILNAACAARRCADDRVMSSNVAPERTYSGDWLMATSTAAVCS